MTVVVLKIDVASFIELIQCDIQKYLQSSLRRET